ncbi:glycosyltransferase [Flavihumibacter stibioxidans]|uniref:Glycosyltransferase 2-like domain-containing protein n=1 Tax=Flavihumibacter stibioxidans TaxID=1834163 RepID=A0ABR7MDP7_9BACT|nr:glycosyltransferase [Flavihumibacter stibioxidans]MBC6493152.1 hypothetical protein [Flavihumibacter stibioxidans]
MAKIAGVVILFNPGQEVLENIKTYSRHISKLFIVDNSPKPATISNSESLTGVKFEFIHDSKNQGIASRLNQVAKAAIDDGFDLLLTMDQDSYFEEPDIAAYMACSKNINWERIAMAGINFGVQAPKEINCHTSVVTELITSGSILNLRLFNIIGGFDENLFIDEVDHDYCYTAIEKGFEIVLFENIRLVHSLGNSSENLSLKSFKKTARTLHSPIRIYFMTRNYFYVTQKHSGHFKVEMKNKKNALLNRIKNNLLYGNEPFLVLKYIIKGLIDFRKQKMGPLSK